MMMMMAVMIMVVVVVMAAAATAGAWCGLCPVSALTEGGRTGIGMMAWTITLAALARGNPSPSPLIVLLPPLCELQSDWTVPLPAGEEARCLAVGSDFVAVATSRQLLRLFSPAGVQLCILSLPGAPVALAANGDKLTAVFHAGNGLAGKQQLELLVRMSRKSSSFLPHSLYPPLPVPACLLHPSSPPPPPSLLFPWE